MRMELHQHDSRRCARTVRLMVTDIVCSEQPRYIWVLGAACPCVQCVFRQHMEEFARFICSTSEPCLSERELAGELPMCE